MEHDKYDYDTIIPLQKKQLALVGNTQMPAVNLITFFLYFRLKTCSINLKPISLKTNLFSLSVNRSVSVTGTVIGSLFIHPKGIPHCRSEHFLIRYIVHANRDTEHRCERDQISADMAIADRTMVCTPVSHHIIDISKRPFTG